MDISEVVLNLVKLRGETVGVLSSGVKSKERSLRCAKTASENAMLDFVLDLTSAIGLPVSIAIKLGCMRNVVQRDSCSYWLGNVAVDGRM